LREAIFTGTAADLIKTKLLKPMAPLMIYMQHNMVLEAYSVFLFLMSTSGGLIVEMTLKEVIFTGTHQIIRLI